MDNRLEQRFDQFSVYGFSIDYVKGLRVEFNPKGRELEGDVAFHFPDKVKIYLSWGDLEKTARLSSLQAHADHSLNKVKTAGNVRNFQQVSRNEIRVSTHEALYSRVSFDEITLNFLTGRSKKPREGHSVHVHCPESGRYFVVYGVLPKEGGSDYERVFVKMAKSLKCH